MNMTSCGVSQSSTTRPGGTAQCYRAQGRAEADRSPHFSGAGATYQFRRRGAAARRADRSTLRRSENDDPVRPSPRELRPPRRLCSSSPMWPAADETLSPPWAELREGPNRSTDQAPRHDFERLAPALLAQLKRSYWPTRQNHRLRGLWPATGGSANRGTLGVRHGGGHAARPGTEFPASGDSVRLGDRTRSQLTVPDPAVARPPRVGKEAPSRGGVANAYGRPGRKRSPSSPVGAGRPRSIDP